MMDIALRNISLSDLLAYPEFKEAFGKDDKETIKKLLFKCGMDIERGVEEAKCKHRNARGVIVDCIQYRGMERVDKVWLQSGYATLEAYFEAADPDLRAEMKEMSKRVSYDPTKFADPGMGYGGFSEDPKWTKRKRSK
jgi:hypothetical protein